METEGGGWTLVWSYTFIMYSSFNSFSNAVTPGPKNLGVAVTSDTAPQNETDYNAVDFLLWKTIGSEFMIKSNINNWVACLPGTGSFVTKTPGKIDCTLIKQINNRCSVTPDHFDCQETGCFVKAVKKCYFFDTSVSQEWPVHDPCGRDKEYHISVVSDPHGNVYLR
jgi:hypothetical protein